MMAPSHTARPGSLAVLAMLVLGASACSDDAPVADAEPVAAPVVAGLARPGLAAHVRGRVLLDELSCTACHADSASSDPRRGPDLAKVGERIRPTYLARFLADPTQVEPGTAMPDVLADLAPPARARAAEALAHYLRSMSPPVAREPEEVEAEAAARGKGLFHTIGCVACHAPRDEAGRELEVAGSVPMAPLAAKYDLAALRAFLLDPGEARPGRRMPDLDLSPLEANDLAHYLLSVAAPLEASAALPPIDDGLVEEGRALFADRGCAACHDLPDAARPATRAAPSIPDLHGGRGCLSAEVGAWAHYPLDDAQRADLAAALASSGPMSDEDRIAQLLVSRNCTACHARGDLGGVADDRADFFTSEDPSLGPESRLAPPLTGVGAKLQPQWLHDAIAHGQRERAYVRTRMPAFGTILAGELAPRLAAHDVLDGPHPPAALPEDRDARKEIIELGRALVGDQGMNCISCHTFAGTQIGMAGIDLVNSTGQRLRPEWFSAYLRDPLQVNPGTIMPRFFVNGTTARPELGDGDPTRQIDAMWHYLAEGRNVRGPSGLRRPPIVLEVDDEAVLLRRAVQHTGKRGISVGYPGGVNVTFDAESLALDQVWWGDFIDASPVWTGQGSGQARILGRQRATLPSGPAFAVLASDGAPWPTATRRDLGHRWLGYDLDEAQRPSFRYACEGVEITDTPRERPTDAGLALRRTLRFAAESATTLTFRAAVGEALREIDDRTVGSDKLRIALPVGTWRIRGDGESRELLVTVPIDGAAPSELTLDYTWQEEGR